MSYKDGGFNKSERKIYKLKSDNYRLKVLLADTWKLLIDSYHPAHWTGKHALKFSELEARIKQEGINDQPNS